MNTKDEIDDLTRQRALRTEGRVREHLQQMLDREMGQELPSPLELERLHTRLLELEGEVFQLKRGLDEHLHAVRLLMEALDRFPRAPPLS